MSTPQSFISDEESVARILHNDWFVGGRLQLGAFTLRPRETYISVNRPSVNSFLADVTDFVNSHDDYQYSSSSCLCAVLKVRDVRGIKVNYGNRPLRIEVEVEPRTLHTASHAGIFARTGGINIKPGQTLPPEALPLGISADDVLMEIGWGLIAISSVEEQMLQGK